MSADVYRAYDAAGRLLYVGCTVEFETRVKYHAEHADWWPFHERIERTSYPDRAEAAAAETAAILTEHPRWNIQGRSPEHPDGLANTAVPASWLDYERDVARRLRQLRYEAASLRRKFRQVQIALKTAEIEAAAIRLGTADTSIEDIEVA